MLTQIAAFVTGSKSAGPAVVADNNDTPVSEVQSLAMLGLRPRVLWRDGPVSASGAGFCWSVRMLSAAPEMLAAELERVRALLLRGIAVNLTLADAGARSSR